VSQTQAFDSLQALISEAATAAVGVTPDRVELTPPAHREHGDLASPLAMALARHARRAPREIAEQTAERLRAMPEAQRVLASVEVAGPGFLNLRLAPTWFVEALDAVRSAGDDFGRGVAATSDSILLEFVSANPTGPMHVGHARHAALGDSLARLLEFVGYRVEREYYVNDYGRQMALFGGSVAASYAEVLGEEAHLPEGGYLGDYITAVATTLAAEVGETYRGRVSPPDAEVVAFFGQRGGELMLAAITADLDRFRVAPFDRYFSETTLHTEGRVQAGVEALEAAGDAYRHDGAVWFRTTKYGDDKDRVLVRADGAPTYLASDVAYHLDKAARANGLLIDILGADHHGYVNRLRAVLTAGGHSPDSLEVVMLQLVSLLERGEAMKMSKRAGTLVTLADLLDDIGVDAARFFLVERSHETPIDLDLDLARERSQENPVYYVQYAHARCRSILTKADDEGVTATAGAVPDELDDSERDLVLRLVEWPSVLRDAAERRAPHRVVAHLKDLARDLHSFYHRCQVVGQPPAIEAFRLDLVRATADQIRCGLDLLGVEAPDRM
jgi:arginyl-tRNA synthetase